MRCGGGEVEGHSQTLPKQKLESLAIALEPRPKIDLGFVMAWVSVRRSLSEGYLLEDGRG